MHTVEGGAIVTRSAELLGQCSLIRAFGHNYDDHHCLGTNAKLSELHGAMGMCVLPHVTESIATRRDISALYDQRLSGASLQRPVPPVECEYNYGYYPVVFPSETVLLKTKSALEAAHIFPRRYFWPSLNTLPYVEKVACPVSEDIAVRVLCLPLYPGLGSEFVEEISTVVLANL